MPGIDGGDVMVPVGGTYIQNEVLSVSEFEGRVIGCELLQQRFATEGSLSIESQRIRGSTEAKPTSSGECKGADGEQSQEIVSGWRAVKGDLSLKFACLGRNRVLVYQTESHQRQPSVRKRC